MEFQHRLRPCRLVLLAYIFTQREIGSATFIRLFLSKVGLGLALWLRFWLSTRSFGRACALEKAGDGASSDELRKSELRGTGARALLLAGATDGSGVRAARAANR